MKRWGTELMRDNFCVIEWTKRLWKAFKRDGRMGEEQVTRRLFELVEEGWRKKNRHWFRLLEEVIKTCNVKSLEMTDASVKTRIDSSAETVWMVREALWLQRENRPCTSFELINEKVKSHVAVSLTIGYIGGVWHKINCVKTPFSDDQDIIMIFLHLNRIFTKFREKSTSVHAHVPM